MRYRYNVTIRPVMFYRKCGIGAAEAVIIIKRRELSGDVIHRCGERTPFYA